MQHPPAAALAQQPGMFPPRMSLQYNNPHAMQDHQQQHLHQQAIQGQIGIRPGGPSNGIHPLHSETATGVGAAGGPPATSGQSDRNKLDTSEAGPSGVDGQGSSAPGHTGGEVSEEAK